MIWKQKSRKISLCKKFAASIMDHSVFWNLNSRCLKRKFKPTFWKNLTGYQNVPANTASYSICNQHTATSSYAFCFIVPWISKIVFHDLLYDDAFFQKQQPTNHFTWDFFLCKMCGFRQMGQRMAILCFDQCYIHWIGNILGLKNHTSP